MERFLNFDKGNAHSSEEHYFLLDQLNKVYSVHSHLEERLSEIAEHPDLFDMRNAINGKVSKAQIQLECLNKLSNMIAWNPSMENCTPIINLLEDRFNKLQFGCEKTITCNFFLFDYLQTAAAILTSSFSALNQLTTKVNLQHFARFIAAAGVEVVTDNSFLPPIF